MKCPAKRGSMVIIMQIISMLILRYVVLLPLIRVYAILTNGITFYMKKLDY